MRIPFLTIIKLVLFVGLLLLQYQNCSSYNDPSLFELPSEGAAASNPADVRLDSPVGVLDIGENDLAFSAGGDCNLGLYSKHYIEIKMTDISGQPIAVVENAQCPPEAPNLPALCYAATHFRCEHGRYVLHLPINCSAYRNEVQSVYRLTGQLVVIEENGTEKRDNKAAFERNFTIAWPEGTCP